MTKAIIILVTFLSVMTFAFSNCFDEKILNKALISPTFEYEEKSIVLEIPKNLEDYVITKWGVFSKNLNTFNIEGEEEFVENQYIVSFKKSLSKVEIERLERDYGVEFLGFIPHNSYFIKGDPKNLISSTNAKLFRISPLLKIDPALYRSECDINPIISILVDGKDSLNEIKAKIGKKFENVEYFSQQSSNEFVIRLFYGGKDFKKFLISLAKLEETIYIEPFFLPEPQNDYSIYVVQSYDTLNKLNYPICATIFNKGITGTDEIISVIDTGLDSDMCFFRYSSDSSEVADAQYPPLPQNGTIDMSKKVIVYNVLPGATPYDGQYTCSSGYHHGTHVCGSVLGDDYLTLSTPAYHGHDSGDGMAPNSKLLFQDAGLEVTGCLNGLANDYTLIFKQAYDGGARISSNSWGSAIGSQYDGGSRKVDDFTYLNEDYLMLFAAGNRGTSGSYTIISPATAKNVLAIGATSHGSYGSNSIASFSSRGPTVDGRLKPDLVAPGQYIYSASADEDHYSNNCSVRIGSGTSMATPTAAGALALLRQYFRKGFYPKGYMNSDDSTNPSSALLRAMAINGAVDISNTSKDSVLNSLNPNNSQGWGRILLDSVLFFSTPQRELRGLRVWDKWNQFGLKSGEEDIYEINVTQSSEPLKVTLCWTEPPPFPLSGLALCHDLDLELISPTGKVYKGNSFIDGSSYPDGPRDYINPVEELFILNPEEGVWTIKVKAFYIPFIPNYEDSERQGYALVATYKDCGDCELQVSNLYLEETSNGIYVSWNSVNGANSYQIFRKEGNCSSEESYKFIKEVKTNNFLDDRVIGGKTYSYAIRAVNSCREGNLSECASISYSGVCQKSPIFDGVKEVFSNGCFITLTWDEAISSCPSTSYVSYNIYRSNEPNFEPSVVTLIKKGVEQTTFVDSEVIPNITYYYIVRAEDGTNYGNGPNNNGNEDKNLVVRYATVHSNSYSFGTFYDDGGDTTARLRSDGNWKITLERNSTTNGVYSYHSGDEFLNYMDGSCSCIETEPLFLESNSNPQMSFYCSYNIEEGYDGVVVEISNDAGNTFVPITPIGGYPSSFYNNTNSQSNGCGYSPSQGAFSGPPLNNYIIPFTLYNFDLSSFSGDQVIIRWCLSSDEGLNYRGFFLDDITITNASLYNDCYNRDGSIIFDRLRYNCQDTIFITLYDSDLINSQYVSITISSDTEIDGETIVLTENPVGSGRFYGTIYTTSSLPQTDGLLSVSEGDLIVGRYLDQDDGKGNNNVIKYSKADVVCNPPDEIAKGLNYYDKQSFDFDKTTQRWPYLNEVRKYRLYRGNYYSLPNLLNNDIDSCLIYEGTLPYFECPEIPALGDGYLYWYLVTGLNEAGEGSAGNSSYGPRILNSQVCN